MRVCIMFRVNYFDTNVCRHGRVRQTTVYSPRLSVGLQALDRHANRIIMVNGFH